MRRRRQKKPYDRFAEYLDYKHARDHNRRPYRDRWNTLKHHAHVTREDGVINISYHATNIVRLDPNGDITLNTGGWRSFTTKARINDILPRRWHLYSNLGVWYLVDPWRRKHVFADGMTIRYRGKKVVGAGQPIRPKDLKALKKRIRKYALTYVAMLQALSLRGAWGHDCPDCRERCYADGSAAPPTSLDLMRYSYQRYRGGLGRPRGDAAGFVEHIERHMALGEYPPEMAINAAVELGCSPLTRTMILECLTPLADYQMEGRAEDLACDLLARLLTRYLRRRYGLEA